MSRPLASEPLYGARLFLLPVLDFMIKDSYAGFIQNPGGVIVIQRRIVYLLLGLSLGLMSVPVWSGEPAVEPSAMALDWGELHELFADKTATCRKEKDQSDCLNYFSSRGEITQVMIESGKRKDGRWFLDDSDRFCIIWNGRLKPLCFKVYPNDDGTYNLVKKGKHISTLLEIADGNTENYRSPCDAGEATTR